MLNRSIDLDGLEDWSIWWGANLGTPEEELVAGGVGDVRARSRPRGSGSEAAAGWVMDIFLVRAGA